MSDTDSIEGAEDLKNVPLVRMEDVQPSRDRTIAFIRQPVEQEDLETCIVDNVIDYDNECVVNEDENSNIGSMVSIQSEEVAECDDSSSNTEVIVPELLSPVIPKIPKILPQLETKCLKSDHPGSWPTLEIHPGGVIKRGDKSINLPTLGTEESQNSPTDMMYACAKCSQSFKYLMCLVKHVKWHEEEKKKARGLDIAKMVMNSRHEKKYICLHSVGEKNTKKSPKKIVRKVIKKS